MVRKTELVSLLALTLGATLARRMFGQLRARRSKSAGMTAALVDAENMSARYFPRVFSAASSCGPCVQVKAYGPKRLMESEAWEVISEAYGVERVVCPGCKAGKNSVDMRMAIDAMDLMRKGEARTIVLASDDSDFSQLALRLRDSGERVVGIGRTTRNDAYRSAFDEFVTIGPNGGGCGRSGGPLAADALAEASARSGIDRKTLLLAAECALATADPGGWSDASELAQLMRRRSPGFRYKSHGCKNLTRFLQKTGMFDISKNGGTMRARLRMCGSET